MSRRKIKWKLNRQQREQERAQGRVSEELIARVQANFPGVEFEAEVPSGLPKMSERLFELVRPFVGTRAKRLHAAIPIAIAAWNSTVHPDEDWEAAVTRTVQASEDLSEHLENVKEIFRRLRQRKLELYPEDQRIILDYKLIEQGREVQLHVVTA